jgi:pSer/pThr/pTyr-binding forkhead associated (FHA) protein
MNDPGNVTGNDTEMDEADGHDREARVPPVGDAVPVLLNLNGAPGSGYYVIDKPDTIIGRSSTADISLQDSLSSRHHASLRVESTPGRDGLPSVLLLDNNSKNGTFVNGRKIRALHRLRHGDRILVGRTPLGFYIRTRAEVDAEQLLQAELAKKGWARSETRFPTELTAEVEVLVPEDTFQPVPLQAVVTDLSVSGARLSATGVSQNMYANFLKQRRYVRMRLTLPTAPAPIKLHGHICWMTYTGDGDEPLFSFGVAFDLRERHLLRPVEEYLGQYVDLSAIRPSGSSTAAILRDELPSNEAIGKLPAKKIHLPGTE